MSHSRAGKGARPRVVAMLAMTVTLSGLAACVVETEPAPRKQLLRDIVPPPPAVVAPPSTQADASPMAAPSASAPPVIAMPEPPPVPDAFRTCKVDSDCAAVLRNGCCHDGRNEPVNQSSVDAYKASFTCPIAHPICPMHLILDHRVPACEAASHMCVLVEPKTAPE